MNLIKQRIILLIGILITASSGFLLWRYYRGTAQNWVRFYLPDVFYVMFWCFVFFLIWPSRTNVVRIPVIVLIVTCILEFLQIWKPPFLQSIRSNLLGAALFGTCFIWKQFPYYFIGCALSILFLKLLSCRVKDTKEN
ncbi:MAG: DUF2809 domain-containing protein [Sedimentisphaerales bacterium]|nr:DUF2809 domain-containing protein [Sedimentisphaerales bacterium]